MRWPEGIHMKTHPIELDRSGLENLDYEPEGTSFDRFQRVRTRAGRNSISFAVKGGNRWDMSKLKGRSKSISTLPESRCSLDGTREPAWKLVGEAPCHDGVRNPRNHIFLPC